MIDVRFEYLNCPSKNGKDYFIYTNVVITGHATHLDYNSNTKVCAGVSACCNGIKRCVNSEQFNLKIDKGYFRCWTDRRHNLKECLDRDTIYALNTLLCQIYEIYINYPKAFKSFELVDVKEIIENERKQRDDEQWCGGRTTGRKHKRNLQRVGIRAIEEEPRD